MDLYKEAPAPCWLKITFPALRQLIIFHIIEKANFELYNKISV